MKKVNNGEVAEGKDDPSIKDKKNILEGFKESAKWYIKKFANDADYAIGKAYEVVPVIGNELTNAGINNLLTHICSASGTKWDNTNAYLCVGDSTAAFAATQTDLQAATNKLRKAMDSGYPTYGTSQKAVWRSTFGSTEANFAWEEFAVANDATAGTILNRKVSSQGTKTAGQTWELTLEITLS